MNLASSLVAREGEQRPVRVALIGAGKFGTMILAQLRLMRGVRLVALADLDVRRARASLLRAGWAESSFAEAAGAGAANDLARSGKTAILSSGELAIASDVEVVIEATGHQEAGARHAYAAIDAGRHVIMVTVEADVVVGPYLADFARRRGVIYTLAYGDQPAIICELVDWARACGLRVIAAGKGTKYLPAYRRSTPDTALDLYGFTPEQVAAGDFNPKMFNSFLDGTKSAIEMAAVANATGLLPDRDGLRFPPCAADDLPKVLRPVAEGGILREEGCVEVVSCVDESGAFVPGHLRWGVFVVFTSDDPYAVRCFTEYGLATDERGKYGVLYRPYHLIGLEVGISVASVACRGEATGAPIGAPRAEVVCATRRAMRAGEIIDGEGGYAAYGLVVRTEDARAKKLLPLGLATGQALLRDVPADYLVSVEDVAPASGSFLHELRARQDALFAAGSPV